MPQNVQVIKQGNENSTSLLRRFSRRVQRSSTLNQARKHRYFERSLSPQMKKQKKLKQLEKTARIKWLIKIGRVTDKRNR